ncbi:hypothetical protein [Flagellimonas myxillae]|uniref:hypothetical protein n=1 Tax=Flagellimonas myxillae TaxID=2942214 RepID=UPI00201EA637|nr:hypothetical protein [Muricauda myxillae]MCL6267562.1 hypothetical protein [Muricauda myxillae]
MKYFVLSIFALFLLGCTSDDDINPGNAQWILDNVVCFCFFGDDFDFSTHTLTFNSDTGMVTIENEGDSQFIAPAGTYPFTDNGSVIGIEGREYTYEEEGNTLVLTYVDEPMIADDEVTYYYTKN